MNIIASNGKLYVIATPIGNLEDVTLRALRILKEVDLIACEDTRVTRKLLTHYSVSARVISYYEQNRLVKTPVIVEQLKQGKNVALVTDSGTPGISDPGFFLVKEVIKQNISVIAVPGPSAVISALSVSGLPINEFIFLGFISRKPGKIIKELRQCLETEKTVVFYESPYRLIKTLGIINQEFPAVQVAVCRELTKMFEEILRGTPAQVLEKLAGKEVKGEITIVLSPEKKL